MAEGKEIEVYKPADFQSRLNEEQEMLEKYFYPEEFPILYINSEPCFERTVPLKCDKIYKLRVYVNERYPENLPDLVVCESPEPMPNWTVSHDTHTLSPKDGFLRICHWHWACWTRENMIYQVFNKGEEWLEAYEKYLENGILRLDLEQMQLTEEENIKVQKSYAKQAFLALCQNPVFLNQWHRWHLAEVQTKVLLHRSKTGDKIPQIRDAEQKTPEFVVQRTNHNLTDNLLAEMFRRLLAVSESPITDDEIRHAQLEMLELFTQMANHDPKFFLYVELCKLNCVVIECKLANPGCTVNFSVTVTDGQICTNVTPVLPQSLQGSDKYSDFMIKHY